MEDSSEVSPVDTLEDTQEDNLLEDNPENNQVEGTPFHEGQPGVQL